MQQANQIAGEIVTGARQDDRPTPSRNTSPGAPRAALDDRALALTAGLWHRFAAAFPHRWLPAVGVWAADSPTVATWASALDGITADQVAQGLRMLRARGEGWPPGAFEFAALCRSDGLPSETDGYLEATQTAARSGWAQHAWSHPVVFHTALSVGRWNLRTKSEDQTRQAWRVAWRSVLERFNAGVEMVVPEPLALPAPSSQTFQRNEQVAASAYQAALDALGGAKPRRGATACRRCADLRVVVLETPTGLTEQPCPECAAP